MTKNITPLESLCNEILLDIFEYLIPQDLFRAFYHLNSRFNQLLQSLRDLTLHIPSHDYTDVYFFPFVRILIVDRAVDLNLSRFIQVRSLILRYPTELCLTQLTRLRLPHVEHLSINHMYRTVSSHIPNICERVFSNEFPQLQSAELFQWSTITTNSRWTLSPSLHILKVGKIDLCVYKAILSSCPNLYSLQLATLTSNNTACRHLLPHLNLKRMIIRTRAFIQPWKDEDVDSCLSYVPNLEYLSVHQRTMTVKRKHDWLASIIARRLSCLHQFDFYFHLDDIRKMIKPDFNTILGELEGSFKIAHSDRYRSRFQFLISRG